MVRAEFEHRIASRWPGWKPISTIELKRSGLPAPQKGCLLGNFSAEVADHSALIRERLAAHLTAQYRQHFH
jgi:hypothetical protein